MWPVTIAAALAVAACSGPLKTDYEKLQEGRANYVAANEGLEPEIKGAILDGDLKAGMTPAEVAAAWGAPVSVNRFENGRKIEWIFGCDYPHSCAYETFGRARMPLTIHFSRAYFYDGRLTDWRRG
jgi:hypothetical protein